MGGELLKVDESGGRKQSSSVVCSGHQNDTHGVGVTGAWAPAGQDDDNITLFEEASGLAHIHGKVDTHVNVLCPHIVGGLGVEHGEDSPVEVGLASCLGITGHREDGGAGPVPGDQVGGPAQKSIFI